MRIEKRVTAAAAILLLLLAGLPAVGAGDTDPSGDWGEAVTESPIRLQEGSLCLTYHIAEDRLVLEDTQSGGVWTNIPDGAAEDETAQGSIKRELQSSLIVEYIDEKNNNFTANSSTSCVSKETNTAYLTDDGLVVNYDFSRNKEQFAIPVLYSIREGDFTAEILFDRLSEYGNKRVVEIRLLPYFGAGRTGEEGYLFVPDGSGAIIDFQDDRGWASTYEKPVYGGDPAQSDYVYSTGSEQIHLPVYGVKKGEQAFLAVLEQGSAHASIGAIQAAYNSSYASVAATFSYRLLDQMTMTDKYGTEKTVTFESRRTVRENPRVRFLLTSAAEADLAGMAALYREYVMENDGLTRSTKDTPGLFLDIYGVSQRKESFFGFLMDRSVAATTAQDLQDIAAALQKAGAEGGVMSLYYFNHGGTGNRVTKGFSLDGVVGSQSEWKDALAFCREQGYRLFWGVNNVRISHTSWGFWKFNAGATNMLQTSLVEYPYKMSIRSVDTKEELCFYLRPDKLQSTLSAKGVDRILDMGVDGILLQDVGSILYSDNKGAHYSDRKQTMDYYTAWMESIAGQDSQLLADGANGYALAGASYVTHLSLSGADFDSCTRAIPFYSLVFHGLRSLASTPLNEAEDSRTLFLQCLLTGIGMTYNLTGESPVVFRNTRLNTLLSSDYRDWAEEIGANSREYTAVHEALQHCFIVDYTWDGDVEEIVYDNGTAIAINSGKTSREFNGQVIPSQGYVVYTK